MNSPSNKVSNIPQTFNPPNGRLKVAVLFSRFGPYHHARLKAAGLRSEVTGVEFSNIDPLYKWDLVTGAEGFSRLTLFSGVALNGLPAEQVANRIGVVLTQINPHVVAIPGWSDRCSLAALKWCVEHAVPVVVMSETTAWDFKRTWLKEALKRRLIRLCAAGLVGGRSHADYLVQLGIKPDNIFLGYDAVDNEYFKTKATVAGQQQLDLRKQHHLPENYFLASARFVEKKNLFRLLQAYAQYRAEAAGKPGVEVWDLVLLGDGPLRDTIQSQVKALHLGEHVFLPGFKQYPELPIYYGLARAFIHASTMEQWGLVVNEAMAAGLPVLVSNLCGCTADLVQEGLTGYSFDPFDVDQMATLMTRCSAQPVELAAMGQAAQSWISRWGVERFADGLAQAADMAMKSSLPKVTMTDSLLIQFLLRRTHAE